MTERIRSINLTEHPGAIAFLNEPLPCRVCFGSGATLKAWAPEEGVIFAEIEQCPLCLGSGFMVYFSWS